jgi:glycosyltransferase involved in cell wall biosynthesis
MHKGSKVVFVMPWHISERGGGAEVQANYLAQELAERGYIVSYVCQTTVVSKINTIEKIDSINVHYLKPSGRLQWQDQNKYLVPLQKTQPDYVLQRLSSNVTYVLGKYCSKNNCKLVWFCTDNKSPFSDFHFSKFKEHSTVTSLGIVKYVLFAINNRLMDFYRNKGLKQVDFAFSQNDFQKEKVKSNFGLESNRMISGHPLPSVNHSISQHFNSKTILWCANFGTHKRPELFIELASKMQHTDLKFVMVGGHSDKEYVKQLLANKPDNLTTTGKLNFDDALSYFNNATIFVNTSTPGGDGFPNTFIQAWLRHVPVISFGFDPDDVIVNNNLGYNVSNINEAIKRMTDVFDSQNKYEELSVSAYNYAIENHSIKRMTDNFLKAISSK